AGTAIGTPAYMSPEQAAGRLDQLGAASDVYGLGATLYHLLTGQPPVPGERYEEIRRKVIAGDIPRLRLIQPGISPALEAICSKAMAVVPGDRYPPRRAVAEDIEHWLADEPVSAWRERWPARVRRWLGRHQTVMTAAAAAIIVAAAGLATVSVVQ